MYVDKAKKLADMAVKEQAGNRTDHGVARCTIKLTNWFKTLLNSVILSFSWCWRSSWGWGLRFPLWGRGFELRMSVIRAAIYPKLNPKP